MNDSASYGIDGRIRFGAVNLVDARPSDASRGLQED